MTIGTGIFASVCVLAFAPLVYIAFFLLWDWYTL